MEFLNNIIREIEGMVYDIVKECSSISKERLNTRLSYGNFAEDTKLINYLLISTLKSKAPFIYKNLEWQNIDKNTLYFVLSLDSYVTLKECLTQLNISYLTSDLNEYDILVLDNYMKSVPSTISIQVCRYYNEV